MSFAENIKIIIALRANNSRTELARQLNMNRSVITRLCQGRPPTENHKERLERLTGVPRAVLLGPTKVLFAFLTGAKDQVPMQLPTVPQVTSGSQATRDHYATMGNAYGMYWHSPSNNKITRCDFSVSECSSDGIVVSFQYNIKVRTDRFVGRLFVIGGFCYGFLWPSDGSDQMVFMVLNTPLNHGGVYGGRMIALQSTSNRVGRTIISSKIILCPAIQEAVDKAKKSTPALSIVTDIGRIPDVVRDYFKDELASPR